MSLAIASITLIIFALALTGLYAATLRFGPRRGHWNQPAAKLRAPGRKLVLVLYGVALLHAVAGFVMMLVSDTYGISVFIVSLLMGGFYVAMGMVMQIATLAQRRSPAAVGAIASGRRRKHGTVRSDD